MPRILDVGLTSTGLDVSLEEVMGSCSVGDILLNVSDIFKLYLIVALTEPFPLTLIRTFFAALGPSLAFGSFAFRLGAASAGACWSTSTISTSAVA